MRPSLKSITLLSIFGSVSPVRTERHKVRLAHDQQGFFIPTLRRSFAAQHMAGSLLQVIEILERLSRLDACATANDVLVVGQNCCPGTEWSRR